MDLGKGCNRLAVLNLEYLPALKDGHIQVRSFPCLYFLCMFINIFH